MVENSQCILPVFNRMREYHLYTAQGERYLDMYQDAGRAVLGHRPKGLSNTLKMILSKGTQAAYPSIYTERLKKLLFQIIPGCKSINLFSTPGEMKAFCTENDLEEPWIWRPWAAESEKETAANQHLLTPVIPHPGTTLSALCSQNPLPGIRETISPLSAAGAVHVLHKLLSEKEEPRPIPSLFKEQKLWNREGIYLYPNYPMEKHQEIFNQLLQQKIILSPEYCIPSIIPAILSDYEITLLSKALKEVS